MMQDDAEPKKKTHLNERVKQLFLPRLLEKFERHLHRYSIGTAWILLHQVANATRGDRLMLFGYCVSVIVFP